MVLNLVHIIVCMFIFLSQTHVFVLALVFFFQHVRLCAGEWVGAAAFSA